MKNAATYEQKVRSLLKGAKGSRKDELLEGDDALAVMLESILQADATDTQASSALEAITKEYVDFNELRASPVKDLSECMGKDHPDRRRKAQVIVKVLANIYGRTSNVSIDYMTSMSKKDLRQHLEELGLCPYSAARTVLLVFGGHAVPVDNTLIEVLKMGHYAHPESDLADIQGFLTRIISHKNAVSAHLQLRQHCASAAKALAKKRKADAAALAKAEAQAKEKTAAKKQAAKLIAKKKAAKKKAAKKKATKKAVKKKAKKSVKKKMSSNTKAKPKPKAKAKTAKKTKAAAGKSVAKMSKKKTARKKTAKKKAAKKK